jgi:hypothetical protein
MIIGSVRDERGLSPENDGPPGIVRIVIRLHTLKEGPDRVFCAEQINYIVPLSKWGLDERIQICDLAIKDIKERMEATTDLARIAALQARLQACEARRAGLRVELGRLNGEPHIDMGRSA